GRGRGRAVPPRRRARFARRPGLHLSRGRRADGAARFPTDRAAVGGRLLQLRRRQRQAAARPSVGGRGLRGRRPAGARGFRQAARRGGAADHQPDAAVRAAMAYLLLGVAGLLALVLLARLFVSVQPAQLVSALRLFVMVASGGLGIYFAATGRVSWAI